MKKISLLLFIFTLLVTGYSSKAQAPQAIPYQAVARDINGNVLANQLISLRITLIDSNVNSIDFQETHQVTTNALGLFTLNIGEGTPVIGALGAIYWLISGNEHVQVEMDPAGGTNYVNMGITKLNSVPFALHANTSGDNQWNPIGPNISNRNSGNVGIGTNSPSAKLDVNGMGFFRNNAGGFLAPSVGAGIKISTENNKGNIFGYNYSTYTPIDLILQNEGGYVGIGIPNPDAPLHIKGNMHLNADNYQGGDGIIFDEAPYAGNGHWIMDAYAAGFPAANKLRIYNDRTGITVHTIMDNGNVGIGDFQYYESALAKLDVKGNVKIADGTQGAGKVLTSDADGYASWVTPSGGGVWTQNGNDISNANTGNVGIGTQTPSALLDVNGDARVNGLTIGIGPGYGFANTVVGLEALTSNLNNANTAIGYQALKQTSTGFWNTAIGAAALVANTEGKYNIGIGVNTLGSNTTGNYNTATGAQSMLQNITGEQNTAYGFNSLTNNLSGNFNTALGLQTLYSNTTGQQNTAVGISSMQNNIDGIRNTALGMNTLYANISGNNNTAIGRSALIANTTGSANTSVGERTLILNQTGSHNTAIGDSAALNYIANDITAIGYQALVNASTGEQNVAVGSQSLLGNSTGSGNTAVGYTSLSGNVTGTNNTALGNNAGVLFSSLTNATAIGANAQAAQNNSIVLGSINGANGATSSVNVGIGNNTPQHTLSIGDATADLQNLMLRGYSNSPLNWKGGAAFGYTSASIIMGELNGVASIGGHDATLSGWANLSINEGGGNVGIGTSIPSAKLDVNGKIKSTNFQMASGASNGAVLTSDASGNASWVAPASSIPVGCVIRARNWTGSASGVGYGAGTYLVPSLIDSFGIFGDTRLVNSGSMNVLLGSAANTLVFTAPSAGYYEVSFKAISVASSVRLLISASLNGASPVEIVDQLTSNPCANCSEVSHTQVIYLNAGDTHRILRSSGGTAINDMVLSYRKL